MSNQKIIKVFVSGCYDILHAGHIQFFEDAKALGTHLTVCFASDEVLRLYKKREPTIPQSNKKILIGSLKMVDQVVSSSNLDPTFDFLDHLKTIKPDILAVTEDDKTIAAKQEMCQKYHIKRVILPKRNLVDRVSTSSILRKLTGKEQVPLRVDFAGGWLDVPQLAISGGYVVNCTISPLVSLENWPYEYGGGLGGSAAKSILEVRNGIRSEIEFGVGWQDPAVIEETGLCVWRSGPIPILESKHNPDWLVGKMLILWTGEHHNTPGLRDMPRDYALIVKASQQAKNAVDHTSLLELTEAVNMSYQVQIKEGMKALPEIKNSLAKKYLGGGHGGYALYLFKNKASRDIAFNTIHNTHAIEPYIKNLQS